MQLGLYRSNYLITTYSEKQTRRWGFLTPTSQPYPHFCVEKQSTLPTVPPQPSVGGCHRAGGVGASPRQHHLPAAQHHWCAPWKAETGDHEKLNLVGKLPAILTTLNKALFSWALLFFVEDGEQWNKEWQFSGISASVHKSQSIECTVGQLSSISVPKLW